MSSFMGLKLKKSKKDKADKNNGLSAFDEGFSTPPVNLADNTKHRGGKRSSSMGAGGSLPNVVLDKLGSNDRKLSTEKEKLEALKNSGKKRNYSLEADMLDRQASIVQNLECADDENDLDAEFENMFSLDMTNASISKPRTSSINEKGPRRQQYNIEAFKCLEANGYDEEIFRSVYHYGSMYFCREGEKPFPCYCTVNHTATLFVMPLADSTTKPKKRLKKKPIATIRLQGAIIMNVQNSIQSSENGNFSFDIGERQAKGTSIYSDRYWDLDSLDFLTYTFHLATRPQSDTWRQKLDNAIEKGNQENEYQSFIDCLSVTVYSLNYHKLGKEINVGIFLDGLETTATSYVKNLAGEDRYVWDQVFHFDAISPSTRELTYQVNRKSLITNVPRIIGTVNVPMDELREKFTQGKNKNSSNWYEIEGGKLMVSSIFTFQKILPMRFYKAMSDVLLNLITDHLSTTVTNLTTFFEAIESQHIKEKQALSLAMTRFYMVHNKQIQFLQALGVMEIQKCNSAEVLFRSNSMMSKSLDFYFNFVGNVFLKKNIQDFLQKLVKENLSCEVDTSLLPKGENLQKNWERLTKYFGELCELIFNGIIDLPVDLKMILVTLRDETLKRSSVFEQKKRRATHDSAAIKSKSNNNNPNPDAPILSPVSGFVFLRFFSAALISPSAHGLLDEKEIQSNKVLRRTLTTLSKSLQKASNFSEFTQKEAYMMPMNEFYKENRTFEKMTLCLFKASTVKSSEKVPKYEFEVPVSSLLSQIHRIFSNFFQAGNESDLVKTITESYDLEEAKYCEEMPQIFYEN